MLDAGSHRGAQISCGFVLSKHFKVFTRRLSKAVVQFLKVLPQLGSRTYHDSVFARLPGPLAAVATVEMKACTAPEPTLLNSAESQSPHLHLY